MSLSLCVRVEAEGREGVKGLRWSGVVSATKVGIPVGQVTRSYSIRICRNAAEIPFSLSLYLSHLEKGETLQNKISVAPHPKKTTTRFSCAL